MGYTVLLKALGSILRFLEDKDLTVEIDACIKTQASKQFKEPAKGYACITRLKVTDELLTLYWIWT